LFLFSIFFFFIVFFFINNWCRKKIHQTTLVPKITQWDFLIPTSFLSSSSSLPSLEEEYFTKLLLVPKVARWDFPWFVFTGI
jgi:hypothetical protein